MGPNCYWITGLSAAGKTTLSTMLAQQLRKSDRPVVHLDGDQLRSILSIHSYTREERIRNGMRYARLCQMLINQNINVVIGVLGLFKEIHEWNRNNIPGYIEIFLDIPIDELIRRDPKGIYKKSLNKEINNVAGMDLAVDFPEKPDVHLSWEKSKTADVMYKELVNAIRYLEVPRISKFRF